MNIRQGALISLLVFHTALVQANETDVTPKQLLDIQHTMKTLRDPQQVLDMADAMSTPEFLMAAMSMSADPEALLKAIEQSAASAPLKTLGENTTPEVIADWVYSSIDPKFHQAILSRVLDPKKPQRWMKAMSNPNFFRPALAMMNPATPMQWMKATADGRMVKPMQIWLNPQTYMNWMRLPQLPAPATVQWAPPQRY